MTQTNVQTVATLVSLTFISALVYWYYQQPRNYQQPLVSEEKPEEKTEEKTEN